MKVCKHCGKNKPVKEYYNLKRAEDGLHYNCKECCRVINQTSILKRKEQRTDYHKKKYAEEHGDGTIDKSRKHKKTITRRKFSTRHAKRASDMGSEADPTISLHRLFARNMGICQLCKKPVTPKTASIDHKIPIIKGGTHTWNNVQLAHKTCNFSKGSKMP